MSRCQPPLESSPKKPPRPPPTDPPSVWSLLQIYCRADCCTGSRAAPLPGRQLPVHTQPFAFRAPHEDDESVKISNTTGGRSSTLSPAPPPLRPGSSHPQNSQFLFDTNERFSLCPHLATQTTQSKALRSFSSMQMNGFLSTPISQRKQNKALRFFLFNTNERSPISSHQSLITTH